MPADTSITKLKSDMLFLAQQVESTIRADLKQSLAGCDALLHEVLTHALMGGGKRLRPFLTVTCARCCGRNDAELLLLGTAFEYLHTATLMHDDVIDHASLRRGQESTVQRFGMDAAILGGDWLHARSMHLIGNLTGTAGLESFCAATTAMVNGEFAQKRLIGNSLADEQSYFAVVAQKTANLISSACTLGCLYAGATRQDIRALSRYGEFVGTAFQIVDDLLDYTGEAAKTGKAVGNDFQEGKMTLPVIRAFAKADKEERHKMAHLFEKERANASAYQEMVAFVKRWGGFQSALETAQDLLGQAVSELAPFAVRETSASSVELLGSLVSYILVRNK